MDVKGRKTLKEVIVEQESDRTKQVVLTVDSTSTTNTKTTLKAKQTVNQTIALPDATTTLVGKDTTDDLSNKTISPFLDFAATTTPASPASGKARLYVKADSKAYIQSSAGIEKKIGSGAGSIKVAYHDPMASILPSGSAYTADGSLITEGETVLFTGLTTGANRIYKVSGVGTALVWTATQDYDNGLDPEDGDTVRVQKGAAFGDQLGVFTGTKFSFNETVRYFSGSDYFEQSSLKSSSITDNTTGNIFTVNATGSENFIIEYSMTRGTKKETGIILLSHDGTNVSVTSTSTTPSASDIGVVFLADITGATLRLRYAANSTGSNGIIRYSSKRWSDASGGPAGLPTYSSVSATTAASGVTGNIQFNGSGILTSDSGFNFSSADSALQLGLLEITKLSAPITLLDNTLVAAALTYPKSYKSAIIEYQVSRNNEIRTGRLLIANNGIDVSETDDYTETASMGISFSTVISGSNVELRYTSSNTGFNATLTYSMRRY